VWASWQGPDGFLREETCVIVTDNPFEAVLFPLTAAGDILTDSPLALQLLALHPWAFPAAKMTLVQGLRIFAKGREYRLLDE
jgi:hypothetical protein